MKTEHSALPLRLLSLTPLILVTLTLSALSGCGGERASQNYREHCSEEQLCDAEFVIGANIDSCETMWIDREREATERGCAVEFEYHFECLETEFTCEQANQVCASAYQEYQGCLARNP